MLKKELESKYKVFYNKEYKTYSVYDNGYLCSLEKKDQKYRIVGTGVWYNELDDLVNSINCYVESLEFPSEFYNPEYREGVFEEKAIIYYLREFGFERTQHAWVKKINNKDTITLIAPDAEDIRENKKIKISRWVSAGRWMVTDCRYSLCTVKSTIIYYSLEPLDDVLSDTMAMLSKMMTKDELKEYLNNKLELIEKESE